MIIDLVLFVAIPALGITVLAIVYLVSGGTLIAAPELGNCSSFCFAAETVIKPRCGSCGELPRGVPARASRPRAWPVRARPVGHRPRADELAAWLSGAPWRLAVLAAQDMLSEVTPYW
jgi:hypothetical protein